MALSSNGLGHLPLTQKIAGSNPARVTQMKPSLTGLGFFCFSTHQSPLQTWATSYRLGLQVATERQTFYEERMMTIQVPPSTIDSSQDFDPEREERHRLKNLDNKSHLAEQLALLKSGKLTAADFKPQPIKN
jgi:hypothetical protein